MAFPQTSFSASGTPATTTGNVTHFRQSTVIIPISLKNLTADSTAYKITIPYAFRVESVKFRVGDPSSTSSKATTLIPKISGTTIVTSPSGNGIALTSANCTPTGATVSLANSAVIDSQSAASTNTGTAGQTLEVVTSSTTSFTSSDTGTGWVEFVVSNIECLQ